jgi:molybdopterin synthase sulfur carrier subunit
VTFAGSVRVELPAHLRVLAQVRGEVRLQLKGEVTQRQVLDALEVKYPMLRGTIRDQETFRRRPFLRFFACEEDLSFESPDAKLPEAVASGKEPFLIIGAVAGGCDSSQLAGAKDRSIQDMAALSPGPRSATCHGRRCR